MFKLLSVISRLIIISPEKSEILTEAVNIIERTVDCRSPNNEHYVQNMGHLLDEYLLHLLWSLAEANNRQQMRGYNMLRMT